MLFIQWSVCVSPDITLLCTFLKNMLFYLYVLWCSCMSIIKSADRTLLTLFSLSQFHCFVQVIVPFLFCRLGSVWHLVYYRCIVFSLLLLLLLHSPHGLTNKLNKSISLWLIVCTHSTTAWLSKILHTVLLESLSYAKIIRPPVRCGTSS